jgi:peptidoglycan/LPS O-acetylase OafA/YrhL
LETTVQHKNNFDFLRLLFASLVIFTHSFALLTGNPLDDPAYKLTHRILSDFAVCGFFVLSGFLIRQSLDRSSSLKSFFKKRALRIAPGLWMAILFTVFIIGTTTTSLPFSQYISNKGTWNYILNNAFLIPRQKTLPGVFENNIETAVNGSLWTLRYELLFYILLSLLFFVPKSKIKIVTFSTLAICLMGNFFIKDQFFFIEGGSKVLGIFCSLGAYFSAGACLSLYVNFIKSKKEMILSISAILFFTSVFIFKNRLETLDILTFASMLVSFGLCYFPPLNFSKYTGDFSYGTYIYAYPIQQTLIAVLHPANVWVLMLPSFILSWIVGLLSWHLIEKQFLKRK